MSMTALVLAALIAAPPAFRIDPVIPQGHVATLADPKLEGRLTLSPGMFKASEYIAREMQSYGLKPGGNQGFFHTYSVTVNQRPGKLNAARFWNADHSWSLELGRDFVPLVGSMSQKLTTGTVVWVGDHDQTQTPDLRDRWVMLPRAGAGPRLANFVKDGAKGIILVGPAEAGGIELPKATRTQGIPSQLGLPAFAVTTRVFENITGWKLSEAKAVGVLSIQCRAVTDLEPNTGDARNVIGVLPGNDPKLSNEVIIVGGHFDHLGYGETGSRTGSDRMHLGADDNASGTAGVLALAEYFATEKTNRRTMIFQAYSGEELGLFGARAWVASNPAILKRTQAMINMDMIGRLREEGLTVFCVDSAPNFAAILNSIRVDGVKINSVMNSPGNSDHAAFIAEKIPCLFFNTGLHDEYHTERDVTGTINFQGISQVLEVVIRSIEQIDQLDARLAFTGTAVQAGGDPNRSRRARVGFIPDMGSDDPRGMRITGVSPGSPAELAGIKAGDILVSFDGKEVRNIEDLQAVLVAAKVGVTVKVIILRGDQRLELDLTPAASQS